MRISDWSSDVCSSDLRKARYILESVLRKVSNIYFIGGHNQEIETSLKGMAGELLGTLRGRGKKERQRIASSVLQKINRRALVRRRTEEITSEHQSLMRTLTYVYLLKNKHSKYNNT